MPTLIFLLSCVAAVPVTSNGTCPQPVAVESALERLLHGQVAPVGASLRVEEGVDNGEEVLVAVLSNPDVEPISRRFRGLVTCDERANAVAVFAATWIAHARVEGPRGEGPVLAAPVRAPAAAPLPRPSETVLASPTKIARPTSIANPAPVPTPARMARSLEPEAQAATSSRETRGGHPPDPTLRHVWARIDGTVLGGFAPHGDEVSGTLGVGLATAVGGRGPLAVRAGLLILPARTIPVASAGEAAWSRVGANLGLESRMGRTAGGRVDARLTAALALTYTRAEGRNVGQEREDSAFVPGLLLGASAGVRLPGDLRLALEAGALVAGPSENLVLKDAAGDVQTVAMPRLDLLLGVSLGVALGATDFL
jgi:hypothetical protein